MDLVASLLFIYLVFNGLLQLFFVWWVLDRNKKLTFLLVEHYGKETLIREIDNPHS